MIEFVEGIDPFVREVAFGLGALVSLQELFVTKSRSQIVCDIEEF
jgi:hypothetical protein